MQREPRAVSHPQDVPRFCLYSITSSNLPLLPLARNYEVSSDSIEQEFSYLGKGSWIVGELLFQGSARIDGEVEGAVSASDSITVGQSSVIIGTIEAAEVIIEGKVKGDIVASRRVVITASAQTSGDVSAPILAMQAGAVIRGYFSTMRGNKRSLLS
jgi:cytoskeletal protein CcmA (bactofilin family)